MSGKKLALLGLAQATGTAIYVVLVVLLIVSLPGVAGSSDGEVQVVPYLRAVSILLLFIVSACVTGALVLGYPAILALRQRIREAVLLVTATVAWLVLIFATIVSIVAFGEAYAI